MSRQFNEEEVFHIARRIADADARCLYLDQACRGDEELRDRIDALLRSALDDDNEFLRTQDFPDEAKVEARVSDLAETQAGAYGHPGEMIGPYKLLEKVGEGGFGTVWAAEQREPVKRRVALKVIKAGMDTRQVVARFEAERQALAVLDHPNIAKILDAGSTELGRPYFVMELVRGIPLTDFCDKNRLSPTERLAIFIDVCHAVQHAHHKGIIHRDIKPSNILITLHDGVPVPKVIDFGIAKATQFDLTEKTIYTQLHQFIGTPQYVSPEQAEMSGLDVDTRSDIYSLGVLLYEILVGRPPFERDDLLAAGISEIRHAIRNVYPTKPSAKLSSLDENDRTATASHRGIDSPKLIKLLRGDLDWIAMKCLEKDRSRRYDTANALATDVTRYLRREPILAHPPSKFYRARKFVELHSRAVCAAMLIGLALLTTTCFSVLYAFRAAKAEHEQAQLAQRETALRVEADNLRNAAVSQKEELRRVVYALQVTDAQRLTPELAIGKLEACDEDLRGWEWDRIRLQNGARAPIPVFETGQYRTKFDLVPNSRQLVVGGDKGKLQLRTGKSENFRVLHELDTEVRVLDLHCSYEGDFVVVECMKDKKRAVELRELPSFQWIRDFEVPDESTSIARARVSVSPVTNHFVFVSVEHGLDVFDMSRSKPIKHINIAGMAVDYHPSGDRIAIGGAKGVSVVTANPKEEIGVRIGQQLEVEQVRELQYSSDGKTILVSPRHGLDSFVWAPDAADDIRSITPSADESTPLLNARSDDLHLHYSSNKLAVVHGDNGEWLDSFFAPNKCDAAISDDRQSLIVANFGGNVVSWELGQLARHKWSLGLHEDSLRGITVHPTKPECASSSLDGTVRIWNYRTGRPIRTIYPGPGFAKQGTEGVEYNADGTLLAIGNRGLDPKKGTTTLWETSRWTHVCTCEGDFSGSFNLRFSPDGELLVGGGSPMSLWEVSSGRLLDQVDAVLGGGFLADIVFSPDGRSLVSTAGWGRSIKVWSVQQRRFESRGELPHPMTVIQGLAFSPDGHNLVAGTEQGAYLFDWTSRPQPPKLLESYGDPTMSVRFTNDKLPRLMMGDFKGGFDVWNGSRLERLAAFTTGTSPVWDISVSPDSKTVLLATGSGEVKVLPSQDAPEIEWKSISRNIAASAVISSAWEMLGVEAVDTEKVIGFISESEDIDDATKFLAIQWAETIVKPAVNERLSILAKTGDSQSLSTEEYRLALRLVDLILTLAPGHPTALLEASLLRLRMNDTQAAFDTVRQSTESHQRWNLGRSARLQIVRALILNDLGRTDEARRELAIASELHGYSTSVLTEEATEKCLP